MTAVPSRVRRRLATAVLATAWWLASAAGLAAQEPADTAGAAPDSAVVVPASGDSSMQARLDSARRMERARRNAVARSLRPGDRVRVRARGRTFDGQFLRLAEGHVFLRRGGAGPGAAGDGAADRTGADRPARPVSPLPDDSLPGQEVQQIPVDAMEALWIRLGRTGTGALWGGILGTVGGAVGGYFINEALCNEAEDCIFDSADAAVVFGIGGGLAGTGFGALIGRGLKEWRQWFPPPGSEDAEEP